jgi:uncharacterized membrane-anchored protein YhcB (DUF1043 family)
MVKIKVFIISCILCIIFGAVGAGITVGLIIHKNSEKRLVKLEAIRLERDGRINELENTKWQLIKNQNGFNKLYKDFGKLNNGLQDVYSGYDKSTGIIESELDKRRRIYEKYNN